MALVAGIGAVFIYFLVIAERKRKWAWCIPLFKRIKWMLWTLLAIDLSILVQRLMHQHYEFKVSLALDGLFIFWGAIYLLKSKQLHYYFKDWQHIDEQT